MAALGGPFALLVAGAVLLTPGGYGARAQGGSGLAPVPAYHGYVNDQAAVIGEQRAAQLESFLDQLHRKTGAQFAVLTVQTCAPEDPTTFKTRVFNTWGIGDKERDDGLLLLVSMQEHAIYFETGYGLEGTLPDGRLGRITRHLAFPEFRAGRPADGITAAVLAAANAIAAEKGVTLEWDGKELKYDEDDAGGHPPSWVIMLVLFVLFFIVFPALASRSGYRRRRGWYSSGGWGGGFGGFGGGFGGGSFGSGGGGGGGFGGFGGGSSGGGGGGGRW
jgi:uncharacterized protein